MERLLEATYHAEQHHFWFHGFRKFVSPLLTQATEGVARPLILDCGCGTGNNLTLLGTYGRAIGFDLTQLGVRYARRFGHRLIAQANVTSAPFLSETFDVLTSFDVLYSLTDEEEQRAVAEMRRLLKPRGSLIINVAAFESLRGKHSVLGQEVRRYRRPRLRRTLEANGFVIRKMTYTNATLFPAMFVVRAAQRAAGLTAPAPESNGDFGIPPAPINRLLSGVLGVEAAIARRVDLPFGSSLLCLARKQ